MRFGYDKSTGALFSWEHDLRFEGKVKQPPDGAFVSESRIEDDMIGAAFMSGWSGTFIVLHSDGFNEHVCLMGFDLRTGYWIGKDIPKNQLRSSLPICICGPIVSSPERMAAKCYQYPTSRMYACPVVDEISAIGALLRNVDVKRPCRTQLFWDNTDEIGAEHKDFDPSMDGDGYGRMADLVAHGLFAVNEMMKTVGVSPFYGKVLHRDCLPESQMIVRRVDVDRLFPSIPVSAKNYAAVSVPVMMETTSQFRAETGYNGPFVSVFVSTDYVPGVSTFMRFYKTFSNMGHVYTSNLERMATDGAGGLSAMMRNCVPVFRSNRAYRARITGRQTLTWAWDAVVGRKGIPVLAGLQRDFGSM